MARVAISLEEMSLGGGPRFSLNLGQALQALGHEVTIVVERPGPWWPEIKARGLSGRCVCARPTDSRLRRARKLAVDWDRSDFAAIFVNVSLLNRLGMLASCLVSDERRVAMILHGDWESLYRLAAESQAHWNCAIGVSPRVEAGARQRLPGKPILGIPNGIEIPELDKLRSRRDAEQPLRLLYLGRLIDSHKGILRLPRILAECRRRGLAVTLTVIGEGEDGPALGRAFVRAGLADRVRLDTAVAPERTAEVLRDHHVLLLPTNNEGMPLVVLEAQANGCVPIVTRLPGITDLAVQHGRTGSLIDDPADVGAFVDAIAALCDPGDWRDRSAAAIAHARDHFSLETMGGYYATLVEELAAGAYPLERPFHHGASLATPPFRWHDRWPPLQPPKALVRTVRRTRHWVDSKLGRPEPRP